METANTNNVAETPSQNDNPTIESLAQALVSAIVAKVQEDIEPSDHELVTEHVLDSEDFHHRVSELAYGQAEDFFCDTDISDKVEECLEYRDWTETVGEYVDASVDVATDDLRAEFASKEYVIAVEAALEQRFEHIENVTGSKNGLPAADLATQEYVHGQVELVEESIQSVQDLLANLPCDLRDMAEVEPRVSDLEHFERRTMERLEGAELRFKAIEERLTELEQFTASKFGQLDNIQIAFRGIVETMFAR
tara:strand:- start:7336 stop:8088 length:753 start_codon:yes stop_codon:yes gene_type:complete